MALPRLAPPRSIDAALTEVFALTAFRGDQRAIIEAGMSRDDVLVLMPTGGGKSLTYQLPAVMARGVTLVVSPLVALIENQISALVALRIPCAALISSIKAPHRKAIWADLCREAPMLRMLYVTPEGLAGDGLRRLLTEMKGRGTLQRLVVDEAHCISEWGHDFRPQYRNLAWVKHALGLPVTALTASATPTVKADICRILEFGPDARTFVSSFFRANLHYEVRWKRQGDNEAVDDIKAFLNRVYRHRHKRIQSSQETEAAGPDGAPPPPHTGSPDGDSGSGSQPPAERTQGVCGIVYCHSRATCERVAGELSQAGIAATSYHAGLTAKQRSEILEDWTGTTAFTTPEGRQPIDVVVATISFGMGIDKKDVRFVIHYDMPKTLEGYYQESGRAGRDGAVSRCILYASEDDANKMNWLITKGNRRARLTQTSLKAFEAMWRYATSMTVCRHRAMLDYFGAS
ncbi:hypothetical protein CXG81DRAFT_9516, partial [Caulochytrium protostelioides]